MFEGINLAEIYEVTVGGGFIAGLLIGSRTFGELRVALQEVSRQRVKDQRPKKRQKTLRQLANEIGEAAGRITPPSRPN